MKVLYAGDASYNLGPIFVASPFNTEVKGFSVNIWGQPLIDALQADVIHFPTQRAFLTRTLPPAPMRPLSFWLPLDWTVS